MQTNGGREFTAQEIASVGTYNTFLDKTDHYDPEVEDFESSAQIFHNAFPQGFLWELIELYSSPPAVSFTWRHWGTFEGSFKNFHGTGKEIEIVGMSLAFVNEELKIERLEHFFDTSKFIGQLTTRCPFQSNSSN